MSLFSWLKNKKENLVDISFNKSNSEKVYINNEILSSIGEDVNVILNNYKENFPALRGVEINIKYKF